MNQLMRNSAGLSRLAWTTGIAVGASLPHWSSLPPWIPALLCLCVGWRFAVRLLRWPLPNIWLIGTLTIGAFVGVLIEFGTINGLRPGTALLVVMIALKFLEAKTQRDQLVLTVISYFLVFAGLLSGGGPLKAAYLLVFVWITTVGLLQVGRLGPLLPNGPTARLAGKYLLQALPLMLVLFIVFPRLSGPLWALPADGSAATTGLSGSMSPGDITNLGLSDAIAFRAEFEGQEPAAAELYWRGPVLTQFDGRRWTQRDGMYRGVEDTVEYLDGASRYRVMLDTGARDWAFALDMPSDWSSVDRTVMLWMRSEYQLTFRASDSMNGRVAYEVTSYSDYRAREALNARDIEYYIDVPPDKNPRTRALVDSWLAESGDQLSIIDRALDVFRAEDFFYTLTPPPLGEHSVDDFIFATREGFCEHYASAFAVMLRMAGIPARVVTGYQGGERNGFGDYYVIRQSNAHAWTEVWLEGSGWQRVDPITAVAPERISVGSTRAEFEQAATVVQRIGRLTLIRQLALSWDAVTTAWNEWVIGYGPRLQRELFERLGFERPSRVELLLLSVIVLAAGMIALSLYLSLRLRRFHAHDRAYRCFGRFLAKLKRLSIRPLRPGETPTAFAERAASEVPELAAPIHAITATYLAARYEPDLDGSALERLRQLVQGFRPRYARAWRSSGRRANAPRSDAG
jgi:transglutaminase-like putative cysteine protease